MDNLQDIIKKLQSENVEERKKAAQELREYASTQAFIDSAFPAIERALSDKEPVVRQNVAWALLNTANYRDITQALPILIKALGDVDPIVRARAVGALRNASNGKQNILSALSALSKALKDIDVEVRREAAATYGNISWYYEYDISSFLLAVIIALGDSDMEVRDSISRVLSNAAFKGKNISAATVSLKKIIDNKNENSAVRINAAGALTYHYLNQGDEKAVAELLKHKDNDVKQSVAWGAGYHYAKRKEWKKIEDVLEDKDVIIAASILDALMNAEKEGTDLSPFLPVIEKKILPLIKKAPQA